MLILVRHGQTLTNAEGRLQGRSDPPLTELGRTQASALASVVHGATRVVCSPLRRARETAAALGLGLPVEVDDRWIEISYGELEGRRMSDVPDETWRDWRADASWVPPGGESLVAVGERVRAACRDLLDEAVHDDVVVVSHVSPIKAAVAWALDVDDAISWRMFLDVASVCRIGQGRSGPSLRSFNDTAHLAHLAVRE